MLEIRREAWAQAEAEIRGLSGGHWQETGDRLGRMAIDWNFYRGLDDQGILLLTVARDGGTLVGYGIMVLTYDPHESRRFAATDAYYLHPAYRKGRNSLRFLSFMEEEAKAAGATFAYFGVHPRNDYSNLLKHVGYREVETYYRKEL